MIGLGTEMLTREFSQRRARASRWMLAVFGIAAGVLCGLFGVGALLAAYVSRVTDDSNAFKGNISDVFIVDGTFRIVLYSVLGLLTLDTVKTAAMLLPFAALGLFAGMKCSRVLDEKWVRRLTSVLLVLSGVSLIAVNL